MLTLLFELIFVCFALLVFVFAVFDLVNDRRDVIEAAGYLEGLKTPRISPIVVTLPLAKALDYYVQSFGHVLKRKAVSSFDVDRELGDVRRAAHSIAVSVRARAGVLILCGLIVTLFKLQAAVGGLRSTFSVLAAQQSSMDGSGDTAAQVVGGMSTVAAAAHSAFLTSLGFIFLAAVFIVLAQWQNSMAAKVAAQFSEWAFSCYRQELDRLPEQVSLNVVASEFRTSAQALEVLTASFGSMTNSFGALQGFSDSMDRSRNAIVEAMQTLPVHIQESMGTLSDKFVGNVSKGFSVANHHTAQILLIYGQQQQRIEKIQAEVIAIGNFSSQVAQAVAKLEGLPENVAALTSGVIGQSASLKTFESTVAELAIRVEDLPIGALREDVSNLAATTERVHAAVTSVEHLGERVAECTELLRDLPEVAKGIATAVYQESNNAVAFRASVDLLDIHVKGLPVPELRAGIASLSSAAEKLGNIHAQTIAAVGEITRRSSAFETAGSDLKGRVEEVLKYSAQLAIQQGQIKDGQGQNAQKAEEALLQLGKRLDSEIQKLRVNPELQGIQEELKQLSQVVNTLNAVMGREKNRSTQLQNSYESAPATAEVVG